MTSSSPEVQDSRRRNSSHSSRLTLVLPSPPTTLPVESLRKPFDCEAIRTRRSVFRQGDTEERHRFGDQSKEITKPGRRLSHKMSDYDLRSRSQGSLYDGGLSAEQRARKEKIDRRVAELRKGFRSYSQIKSSERRRCVCCVIFWILAASGLAYCGFALRCNVVECCGGFHLHTNFTGLKTVLRESLYGQHLVPDAVISMIRGHTNNPSPTKPLVLSFHGWTGNGKNFVSDLIAEHIFYYGVKSRFVQKFIASLDFAHPSYAVRYKEELRRQILATVASCERQTLFIFDEMDKLPNYVLDGIVSLLSGTDRNDKGIDMRRSIFLFISNAGGQEINDYVTHVYNSGRSRESILVGDMEHVIGQVKHKGAWFQSLIDANVIDLYVPFLPMERKHVMLCAKADMERKGYVYSMTDLERIADEMSYFPEQSSLFSESGCKKVSSRIDLIMG
ncbi:torsin-1A-like [Corticium candelabrum]|uniref:torsin-1A-like n=1 Tax=Corticium candelabrum TaxID=121492 RepID=UPI002E25F96C|nr:torsin-1A-like [Corticium candelabrum]